MINAWYLNSVRDKNLNVVNLPKFPCKSVVRTCVILRQYPLSDTYKGVRSSHNQNNFYPPLMWTFNFTSPLSCDAKLNKLLSFKTYLAAVYCSSACGLKYSLKGRQRTLILRGHRETLRQR